jgi:microcystin-dependent protein
MGTPFIGQIALVAFNFAPRGWAFCNGQTLSIAQNGELFTLLGTTYGGDGMTTFNLPDLRGRVPIHMNAGGNGLGTYAPGQVGGSETVTLNSNQLPSHTHQAQCFNGAGDSMSPSGALWANAADDLPYVAGTTTGVSLLTTALQPAGGGQSHPNLMPSVAINYIIALVGIAPSST